MGKQKTSKQSPTCSGRWCETHHFEIKPHFISLCSSKQDSLRFCPKYNKLQNRFEKTSPKLNLDKRYYTPNFILEEDERVYIYHDNTNLKNFQENIREEQSLSEIMVPKVSSKDPYCSVCRLDYQDYLEHINSAQHAEKITRSPYSNFIAELGQNFKTEHPVFPKLSQTASFSKEAEANFECEMESQLHDKETGFRIKEVEMEKDSKQLQA